MPFGAQMVMITIISVYNFYLPHNYHNRFITFMYYRVTSRRSSLHFSMAPVKGTQDLGNSLLSFFHKNMEARLIRKYLIIFYFHDSLTIYVLSHETLNQSPVSL